jgi:menaquinone-specific isochorismate synthase
VSPLSSPVSVSVHTQEIGESKDLLTLLPESSALAWVRGGDGLVGWGEFDRIEVTGADRFEKIRLWWRERCAHFSIQDEVKKFGTGPVLFLSGTFDGDEPSIAIIPKIVVGQRNGRTWTTWIGEKNPPAISTAAKPDAPLNLSWVGGTISPAQWEINVGKALEKIYSGEISKVVLARDLIAQSDTPFDARHIMKKLGENYRATWIFSVANLVGATPELLVRLNKGLVTSRILAGTIQRTGNDERDLALAASLARSSKDLEEHEYAVDSVAQSLAPFCSSTNVPETPFVLHLSNVMHLATDVTGVLTDSLAPADLFTVIRELHPSAAVCGTPRPAAQRAIREIEAMSRGRYAGPVGWIDSKGEGEIGIALRCAQINPENLREIRLFAGCGIVQESDPTKEYAESQAKLLPIREALESL